MNDRAAMLTTIDLIYDRRVRGDKAGVAELLADGATFRIAGDVPIPGVTPGEGLADRKIAQLIDSFVFHEFERLDTLVDGDRLAMRSRVRVSHAGGDAVTAELYDLWTFDSEGKIASGLQFADATLVAHVLGLAERKAK